MRGIHALTCHKSISMCGYTEYPRGTEQERYDRLKREEFDRYERLMRENSPDLEKLERELMPMNRKARRIHKKTIDKQERSRYAKPTNKKGTKSMKPKTLKITDPTHLAICREIKASVESLKTKQIMLTEQKTSIQQEWANFQGDVNKSINENLERLRLAMGQPAWDNPGLGLDFLEEHEIAFVMLGQGETLPQDNG